MHQKSITMTAINQETQTEPREQLMETALQAKYLSGTTFADLESKRWNPDHLKQFNF